MELQPLVQLIYDQQRGLSLRLHRALLSYQVSLKDLANELFENNRLFYQAVFSQASPLEQNQLIHHLLLIHNNNNYQTQKYLCHH